MLSQVRSRHDLTVQRGLTIDDRTIRSLESFGANGPLQAPWIDGVPNLPKHRDENLEGRLGSFISSVKELTLTIVVLEWDFGSKLDLSARKVVEGSIGLRRSLQIQLIRPSAPSSGDSYANNSWRPLLLGSTISRVSELL